MTQFKDAHTKYKPRFRLRNNGATVKEIKEYCLKVLTELSEPITARGVTNLLYERYNIVVNSLIVGYYLGNEIPLIHKEKAGNKNIYYMDKNVLGVGRIKND